MSSIALTLELVQFLDELVLGTKVVGNYFRGKKSESFLLIYWNGSPRAMWAWELAPGTGWDHIARDWSGLWQLDWLKWSQNCHQSWSRAVGQSPTAVDGDPFLCSAVPAAGPQPPPPTKRCSCLRCASRASLFAHPEPRQGIKQTKLFGSEVGWERGLASRQGSVTPRRGTGQEGTQGTRSRYCCGHSCLQYACWSLPLKSLYVLSLKNKKIKTQRQTTRWLADKIYSHREKIPGLFILVERDVARRDGKSWSQANFTWEIRRDCSAVRVVNQWNRLPREAVDFPFLQVFSSGLDVFVENTFNKHEILGSTLTHSVKFCCAS